MKFESENKISMAEFLRIVADRACFSQDDAKAFWKAVQEVFEEIVISKSELYLGKLGHLHYTITKERTLPDPGATKNSGETVLIHRPASIRPILSLAVPIKQLVRERTGTLPWKQLSLEENDKEDTNE
jgi:nucleoid DNA-binding protein